MSDIQVIQRPSERKTDAQLERVAKLIADGKPIKEALLAGGYSENVAKRGKDALNKAVVNKLVRRSAHFKHLGQAITAEDQEAITRGRLLMNVMNGKDDAVRSAELFGKDKRVNMFAADQMTGVIVLQMPQSVTVTAEKLAVMDAEVIGDVPELPESTS